MSVRWLTAFIDMPGSAFERGCAFWQAVTGYPLSDRRGRDDEFATLLPPDGDAFLRVQRVASGSGGYHVDVHTDRRDAMRETAERAGARVLDELSDLVVMSSPTGFVFCVVDHEGESVRPAPTGWPGGAGIVDQMCLDIPPDGYDDECRFWARLTSWPLRDGTHPEFRYLERPTGMPLRLLLQRLDDAAPRCTAHLDIACEAFAAERQRHEALGAETVRETTGWVTLRSPAGQLYCITRRRPGEGPRKSP